MASPPSYRQSTPPPHGYFPREFTHQIRPLSYALTSHSTPRQRRLSAAESVPCPDPTRRSAGTTLNHPHRSTELPSPTAPITRSQGPIAILPSSPRAAHPIQRQQLPSTTTQQRLASLLPADASTTATTTTTTTITAADRGAPATSWQCGRPPELRGASAFTESAIKHEPVIADARRSAAGRAFHRCHGGAGRCGDVQRGELSDQSSGLEHDFDDAVGDWMSARREARYVCLFLPPFPWRDAREKKEKKNGVPEGSEG